MRRQDIIVKLMNEGFSQKTLVNLTDKQLTMLSERIISEQIGTTSTTTYSAGGTNTPVLNIPKTDVTAINKAKAQKKTFATYEGEVKENLYSLVLTATGFTRRDVKKLMYWHTKNHDYIHDDYETYSELRAAFRGGNTHCSRFWSGVVIRDSKEEN